MRSSKWLIGAFVGLSLGWIALSASSAKADTFTIYRYGGTPLIATFCGTITNVHGDFNTAGGAWTATINGTAFASGTVPMSGLFDQAVSQPIAAGDSIFGTWAGNNLNWFTFTYTASACSSSIAFTVPTSGGTSPDFPTWQLALADLSTTSTYRIDVEYQEAGTSLTTDDFNIISPITSVAIGLIGKSRPLFDPTATSTIWSATAFLTTNTSTAFFINEIDPGSVIASTTITFTIGTTTAELPPSASSTPFPACSNPPPPFFQIVGSPPYFAIGNPLDSITYGGCIVLTFAFVPTSDEGAAVQAQFNAVGAVLSKKPPTGYFEGAITAMSSFSVASSSTSTILDATSSAEVYGITEPLDAGVGAIIGFMLLIWLFNRGRHFEL